MNLKKQFIIIKIVPHALPETRIATLPYAELSTFAEIVEFLQKNSLLPLDAELDERNFIVEAMEPDSEDEDDVTEEYGDLEGCYLTFTAGETHYHVIAKEILL